MAKKYAVDDGETKLLRAERFLDVALEPHKLLSPITDYENEALVSLDEAVRQLEKTIKNIQGFVWVAKSNCNHPKDDLAIDESAAIYLYTMECLYCQLNEALRNKNRQYLLPFFPYLKLFLTALWRLPDVKGVVWRGIRADIADQFEKGQTVVWWGLSSCTTALSVLQSEQFLGKTGKRTLFMIECINGKVIQNHSHYESENEVLLLPCSYFEIVDKISQGNELHTIHLRQKEPPFPLIQPPFAAAAVCSQPVEAVTSSLDGVKVFATATKKKSAIQEEETLNFDQLTQKPKVSIQLGYQNHSQMAANNEFLLCLHMGDLVLYDAQGKERLKIRQRFSLRDICWSSYFERFLLLYCNELYSLDLEKQKPKLVHEFDDEKTLCRCCDETSVVVDYRSDKTVEIYDLKSSWKLLRRFEPPRSCEKNQSIRDINFNSSGTHLGLIVKHGNERSFHLRNADDMGILQIIELDYIHQNINYYVTALPTDRFLVQPHLQAELYLIDANGKLEQTVRYNEQMRIQSTAFIVDRKCLAIYVWRRPDPDELHFYDL